MAIRAGRSVYPDDDDGDDDDDRMSGAAADSPAEDAREEKEAEERRSPSGKVVYAAVLKEADEELERSSSALFWSGLAAGLSMGFSLLAEAALRRHLPDADWRPLVTKLGYAVGFVIVILGRQQLFTENTLTPMLPLLQRKDRKTFLNVLRLWGVVLGANMLGALAFGFVCARADAFNDGLRREFILIGESAMQYSFSSTLLRAVFAGWLIALLVWMLPYAQTTHFFVIILITWLIGVCEFSHIIAGAVETFTVGWAGTRPWGQIVGSYILPTLVGNIIGGVTLVAALNHAQVAASDRE